MLSMKGSKYLKLWSQTPPPPRARGNFPNLSVSQVTCVCNGQKANVLINEEGSKCLAQFLYCLNII